MTHLKLQKLQKGDYPPAHCFFCIYIYSFCRAMLRISAAYLSVCVCVSVPGHWAVARARRPWAGLTLCVYMDVHASGSRSLPRAATLSSTY